MKRYSLLLATSLLALVFAFQGCKGPEGIPGPQGPEGPQGPAGPEILPVVFDVEANFTEAGQYRQAYNMPSNLDVYDTDIVLVYWLYDIVSVDGKQANLWRALPQIVPVPDVNGFFQYNFDFTQYDLELFMNGTVDLSTLDDSWTQKQIFRVAVLPAEPAVRKTAVDLNNYEEMVKAYGIDESKIKSVSAK